MVHFGNRSTHLGAFGQFADIETGKNVLTLFRYGPQYLKAVEILKCGLKCGQAVK